VPNQRESLDEVDASWDEPEEPDAPEPSPTPDLDTIDDGWESPKRHRTGAERAAARKDKALARAHRQKERASFAAANQKRKKARIASEQDAPRKSKEPARASSVALALTPSRTKRSWVRMLVAVAVIVAVAAFVLFVIVR